MNKNYLMLKEIKSLQKRPNGIFGSFMTRTVSHVFALAAYKLHLSPNMVSFLSLLLCTAGGILLLLSQEKLYIISAIVCWWLGAIFDAADGDLARFAKTGTPFGGWFDSFLDRLKEFFIFSVFGYLAWKHYNNDLFLLLGVVSVFSNVISGYISDTKKLFISEKRNPEIVFSKNFSFGMVDTRDFIIILSLILNDMRIALFIYGILFPVVVFLQTCRFTFKYGIKKV